MPLSMVDDILAVARCSESLAVNTYINAQIELKKLWFHTPDQNSKSKCHILHIGKNNKLCPTLMVHGTVMGRVTEDSYLGDVISADGSNSKNISSRVGKGMGIVTDIMKMLEKVKFGPHYFQTALLLRESLLLNSILTNSGVWYGLTDVDIKKLEDLDLSLLRKILNAPFSVPPEGVYLELGCLNINTLIKEKRENYLHYLISQSEHTMLRQFFNTQWKYSSKNDWTERVKADLKDFGISDEICELKSISNLRLKSW